MPCYELWVHRTPSVATMVGMRDSVSELESLREAIDAPLERCVVAVLQLGVPSNYLPALEWIGLEALLERGEDCDCGCGGLRTE